MALLNCVACDAQLRAVARLCDDCDELCGYGEDDSFPVVLGHSIRGFVRRARVEELVEIIEDRLPCTCSLKHMRHCGRAFDALYELAAMARGMEE